MTIEEAIKDLKNNEMVNCIETIKNNNEELVFSVQEKGKNMCDPCFIININTGDIKPFNLIQNMDKELTNVYKK